MTPKDVGNNIVYFRKKCNLSQKELAKKLNVSNKLVSKWETGLSYPSIEYLNEISTILEVDIRYLISSNEEETKKYWCNQNQQEKTQKPNL